MDVRGPRRVLGGADRVALGLPRPRRVSDPDIRAVDASTPRQAAPSRLTCFVDAAIAAGASSTGALLIFGRARAGMWEGFAQVGRTVGREWTLSTGAHAALGLTVHLGQMAALGAAMALMLGGSRIASRLRAALLVVLAWELVGRVPWLSVLRADVAFELALAPRVGLAAVLVIALALAPRRR